MVIPGSVKSMPSATPAAWNSAWPSAHSPSFLKSPGLQSHSSGLDAPVSLVVPPSSTSAHDVPTVAPGGQYSPIGQMRHERTFGEYEPARQGLHEVAPLEDAYLPMVQLVHSVLLSPAAYVPGAQAMGITVPAAHVWPSGQGVHSDAAPSPPADEYEPAGHGRGVALPALQYSPICTHRDSKAGLERRGGQCERNRRTPAFGPRIIPDTQAV